MTSFIPTEPNLIVASDVFGDSFGLELRKEIWAACNFRNAIAGVSNMLALLDRSMLTNGWNNIEREWGKR